MSERDARRQIGADGPSVEVLARYVAGESASDEAVAVRTWLEEYPEQARSVQALESAMATMGRVPPEVDVEAALARVHAAMAADTPVRALRPRRRSPWIAYAGLAAAAAIVVAFVGGGWWTGGGLLLQRIAHPGTSTFSEGTGPGGRGQLRLPDGTTVLLGPNSEVAYNSGFNHWQRTVTLRGMAEFDVRHNDKIPFVVMVGGSRIEDVGTRFIVRGDNADTVVVAVTAGSVDLSSVDHQSARVRLHAGNRGIVSAGQAAALPGPITFADTAWTLADLAFVDTPFRDVAAAISAKFAVRFDRMDSTLARRHFTGTFRENDSLERVLSTLGLALDRQFTLDGRTVDVSPSAAH